MENKVLHFFLGCLKVLFPISLFASLVIFQYNHLTCTKEKRCLRYAYDDSVEATHVQTNIQLTLLKKIPDFGFDNLVTSMVFLKFLGYFGDDDARNILGYSLTPKFFEVIVPRDPYYRFFYLFLSGSTSSIAGLPEQSVALTAEGLKALKPTIPNDSFYVWRYRGIDELLYLNAGQQAQNSFQTAANWANQSAYSGASIMAQQSQQTADFLRANPDSARAQINAWSSILVNAIDDMVRQSAISHIEALGGEVLISENGQITVKYTKVDQ